ncbi:MULTISPECIES: hypothetical protein [Cryobacterium]|uniref:hypothetical protein n=1 Tax=Cryobacterium TaxID=69578 RepID=UPI000CD499B7|nr:MULTISPECIES: hypothetical protein [Cryobacterium]TFC52824.1 hypothetical protein E3O68_13025 [Cryobacterium sp. TMB3-1-2]TFC62235.1 hypothetical protein E3O60_02860 [Cryobacterium sp. TMB1-7]TFC70674.1 hypothetical protein E3T21_09645 [Cryobacterium sp. TMB3-15]TFD37602.1 hypothetical protein E3T58_18430 [Cryobacterium sp. TMB3-12]
MAINSAHRWLAGSKRFAMIALLPAIILTVGCTAQAPELVGSSTVKAAFIDFVGSVEGVKSVRTRNWLSGFLEPGTMVVFDVTLGDESDSAEVDSTARLITEWVRTRVDPKADVTVYVTLFTAGNAVSLTADDASNWARIQIVDRAVASSAVDHAWLRAPWLEDPRNSDNGTNLQLVSSLPAEGFTSTAFAASMEAYQAFLPPESSFVTVIDSDLASYSSGFETKYRSLTSFVSEPPSDATLQCVDQVAVDPGVMGYDFAPASEFWSSTVDLQAADSELSKARLSCLNDIQKVEFTLDGK